jgi:transcriptional regulator of acetoin/glycerol metabolism
MQSAVMLTDGDRVDVQMFPDYLARALAEGISVVAEAPLEIAAKTQSNGHGFEPPKADAAPTAVNADAAPLLLDEVIKRTLMRSLEETEGNRRRAANLLGISRSTLYRMLTRYGLASDGGRRRMADSESRVPVSRQPRF